MFRRWRHALISWLILLLWASAQPAAALEWPGKEEELVRKLASGRSSVRMEALRALAGLSTARLTPHLLKALEDSSTTVQREAARIAAVRKVTATLPVFKRWLSHWDTRRRVLAAESLGRLGTPAAVKALVRALDDPEKQVRRAVVLALGEIGTSDRQEVPPLIRRLEDSTSEVRKEAVLALARKADRRAVIPLMALLRDPHSAVRLEAARALGGLGDPGAGPVLVAALDDSNTGVVSAAVEALATLRYAPAEDALIDLFLSGPTSQRERTARALATLGGPRALDSLARALGSSSLGEAARRALVSAGAAAAPHVVRLLSDPHTPRQVALAAVEIAAESRLQAAVAPMAAHLRRGRLSPVRLITSLGAISHPSAQRPLLELLESTHAEIRRAALAALAPLADRRAARALTGLLDDADGRVRIDAVRLLGRLGARSAAASVARLTRSEDDELTRAATEALGQMAAPRTAPTLLGLLGHRDRKVRRLAGQALAQVGGAALEADVRRRCAALRQGQVSSCLQALGSMLRGRPGSAETRAYLFRLLASPRPGAQLGALDALDAMRHPDIPGRLLARYPGMETQARLRVLRALGRAAHQRAAAAALLLEALDDPLPNLRAAAAAALGQLNHRPALAPLRQATRDPHWTVRVNASAALVQLAGPESAELFRRLAVDRIPMVRANALLALGRPSDDARAGRILGQALARDRYPWARLNALRALLTAGFTAASLAHGDERYSTPAALLQAMARYDRDSRVRAICAEMLRRRKARSTTAAANEAGQTWLGLYLLDSQRAPLRDSPILLVDASGLVRVIQSDERGEAWLEGLPPGRAHVETPLLSTLPTP